MKDVEYFTFTLPPDVWKKTPRLSKFKLSMEEAAKWHPGASPIADTREVRQMPDTSEERAATLYSHFNGYPAAPRTAEEVCRRVQEYEDRMKGSAGLTTYPRKSNDEPS